MILGYILIFTAYLAAENTVTINPHWILNLKEKCGEAHPVDSFANGSLVDSGDIIFGYGAYLGILFQTRYFNG